MKNRLYMGLFAVAISMSCVSGFAAAPVIRDLPEVNIGDNENNIGTDNNFFVFTDAFKLDNFVSSSGTTAVTSLIWSFDEHTTGSLPTTPTWFQINGIDPVLSDDAAINTDQAAGYPAHVNPTGKNLRAVSSMASFRDVILSPVSGGYPFHPTAQQLTDHAGGKRVRFYVSDGTTTGNVGIKDTLVKAVDGTSDSLSGGNLYVVNQDDTFTTGDPDSSGLGGWAYANGSFSSKVYSLANHSIGVTIAPSATQFRNGTWQANYNEWLAYSLVNSSNVVRGKFYMYATGQTQKNQISNFRVRLQERFAVTDGLCVNAIINVPNDSITTEVQPSQDPTKPSLYRADIAPVNVPFLTNSPVQEGIQRFWDVYADKPQFTGTLALCESVIGTYPRSLIANTAGTLVKTYLPYDLQTFFPGTTDNQTNVWILGTGTGDFPTSGTGQTLPTITESATLGVTLDSSLVSSSYVGNPVRQFNPPQDFNNIASLERVVEGKQWTVRWHLTSTKASNRQSHMRLVSRSLGFAWSHQFEMGGAWIGNGAPPSSGGSNNQIAQETVPGTSCQNPDKNPGDTNGGWYTQILHTPMSQDIRPDVPGTTIAQKMPQVSALPGPGSPTYAGGVDRAWRFSMDIMDTLSNGALKGLEEGNVTLDRLELRRFDLVEDN